MDFVVRNRDHFRTGEPARSEAYYTPAGQADLVAAADRARETGTGLLFLVEEDGVLVGRAQLNSVIRGAFDSASVGYGVDRACTGRGIATAALRLLVGVGFDVLGLHRLQGETLVDNVASQGVLAACGFEHYGTAPDYLRIDGRWRAHELFQRINPGWRPRGGCGGERRARDAGRSAHGRHWREYSSHCSSSPDSSHSS